jgi:hypothetical protein
MNFYNVFTSWLACELWLLIREVSSETSRGPSLGLELPILVKIFELSRDRVP